MVAEIKDRDAILDRTDLTDNQMLNCLESAQIVRQIERSNPDLTSGMLYPCDMFSVQDKQYLNHLGYLSIQAKLGKKLKSYYCLPDSVWDELIELTLGNVEIKRKAGARRPIRAINSETGEILEFKSVNRAAGELNCDKAAICRCLKGEGYYKQVKGWRFEYADNQ